MRSVEVLERDAQGRGTVVAYEVDAKVKRVRYRLRQVHEPPHRLGSEYLGGDFREFAGEWRFSASGTGAPAPSWSCGSTPGASCPHRCAAPSPTR